MMAIRRKILLPKLNLKPVDELIAVRAMQHGGSVGAPPIITGARQGAALNESCITMLSALLQGYVEDVFLFSSKRLFKTLKGDEIIERYQDTYFRWGNPNVNNIRNLFRRLGIDDVFDGLSWQKCPSKTVAIKLQEINECRNKIAHGKKLADAVKLAQVRNLRNFVEIFGQRFAKHVYKKLPK